MTTTKQTTLEVTVDSSKTFDELVKGRTKYITDKVLKEVRMPDNGATVIEFFKIDEYISAEKLEKEYETRNLEPVNVYTLAHASNQYKEFFDEKNWIATQWRDSDNEFCFAAFDRWPDDGRDVDVDRGADDWSGGWWFCGVSKVASTKPLDFKNQSSVPLTLNFAIKFVKERGYKVIQEL